VTEEDAASLTDGVGDHSFVLEFLLKGISKNVSGYLQKFLCHRHEIILGQPTMALRHGFGQGVRNPGSRPDHGCLLDAEFFRDLVSRQGPNALDVPRKAVWILADQGDRVGAVGLVNAHGA
jgi:hypothetical protein